MKKAPQNLLQGQAGVYRVAAELCLRGFNPHFPAVDIGADMVLNGGIRIQVKCAHRRQNKVYPSGAYWFKLGKNSIRSRRQVWENRIFSNESDFVVFWGIEDDRFWIAPSSECDDHQCLVLGPQLAFKVLDLNKIREFREQGMFYEEIGERLGVSAMTISRRHRGIISNSDEELSARIRPLENRWDLIASFAGLIEEEPINKTMETQQMKDLI